MNLKEVQNKFHTELDDLYGKEEVDSFFFILSEAFYKVSRLNLAMNPDVSVDDYEIILNALQLLKNEANFINFKNSVLEKIESTSEIDYKTDQCGLSCIRYLAHSYHKNEILPEEWRAFIDSENITNKGQTQSIENNI